MLNVVDMNLTELPFYLLVFIETPSLSLLVSLNTL